MKKKPSVRKAGPKIVKAYGNAWEEVFSGTKKEVEAAEQELGVKFPKDLAEFLITCGGGLPENNFYEGPENGVFELTMGYVFPLKDHPKTPGIVSVCKLFRTKHGLSKALLPFARDSGDANLICFNLSTKAVVYWIHDEEGKRPGLVAKSFRRFITGLCECPF